MMSSIHIHSGLGAACTARGQATKGVTSVTLASSHVRRVLAAAILVLVVAAVTAGAATASSRGNWNLDRINQVASSIAGHPVGVYCEDSNAEWVDVSRAFGGTGDGLMGFTWGPNVTDPFGNVNAIYLNPQSCVAFHIFDGEGWGTNTAAADAGVFWLADAIIALTHESQHQAGVTDEGVAQCNAITALRNGLITSAYGIPTKISQMTIKKNRHGKLVKVRVVVANPVYYRLLSWINVIHSTDAPIYK